MKAKYNSDARNKIKEELNKISDENTIIKRFGLPIAGIGLPKQKPLKKITQGILKESGLVFWDRSRRIDHTFAFDLASDKLLRVTIDHTMDALTTINIGGGVIQARSDSKETIPFIAIVGFDGFASQRNLSEENGHLWFARVKKPLQSTKAGLVLAARHEECLINLANQNQIVVAATYEGLFKGFLKEAFGAHAKRIRLIPRKGGTEGTEALLPGIRIIGDLTDSGASLVQNGLNFVIPVSDSAPVLVTHANWIEHVDPKQIKNIEDLAGQFQEASVRAYPNENLFDTRQSGHATDPSLVGDSGTIKQTIMSLPNYLNARGKSGKRENEGDSEAFYGLELT